MGDGFIAEERAAFGVKDFAAFEENNPVGFARVDVQRAGLMRLAEHLNHARQIEMREAAAQGRLRGRKHLRGLKAVLAADEKAPHVRGDVRGRQAAIHIIIAAGAIRFEQRLARLRRRRQSEECDAVFGSARRIGAISRAPISRRFVAQTMAAGVFHSSIVSA